MKILFLITACFLVFSANAQSISEYDEISAKKLYYECIGDSDFCRNYIAGFTQTLDVMLQEGNPKRSICGVQSNLPFEFMESLKNRELFDTDSSLVLIGLIKKFHTCEADKKIIQKYYTAGSLQDLCEFNMSACSSYILGFVNLIKYIAKKTDSKAICGNTDLLPFYFVREVNKNSQNRIKNPVKILDEVISRDYSCAR